MCQSTHKHRESVFTFKQETAVQIDILCHDHLFHYSKEETLQPSKTLQRNYSAAALVPVSCDHSFSYCANYQYSNP